MISKKDIETIKELFNYNINNDGLKQPITQIAVIENGKKYTIKREEIK